jgi:hypothetical protein
MVKSDTRLFCSPPFFCSCAAFSPLEVEVYSEEGGKGLAAGAGGDGIGNQAEAAEASLAAARQARTLSISKSGTIQIAGFEIRRSGLLATPLKARKQQQQLQQQQQHAPGNGGSGVGGGDGAMCEGEILSTQLADGGLLLGLQDALAPLTVLGRGAGGTVWQAVHVPSLRVVAVKTIPVFEEGRRHQMVRELRALYANLVCVCVGGDGAECVARLS